MRDNIARDFGAAAEYYDAQAELQRRMGADLAGLAGALLSAQPHPVVLDAGCGTGRLLAALARRRPGWKLIGVDLAEGMCAQARHQATSATILCADMGVLPVANGALHGILSTAALQWAEHPAPVFAEWARVLRPGGVAVVSTFGPGTLRELAAAFAAVDGWPHLHPFPTRETLITAAQACGLTPLQVERRMEEMSYPSVAALMRHLKAIGARNKRPDRRRGLFTPRMLSAVESAYVRPVPGSILASWEVLNFVLRREG